MDDENQFSELEENLGQMTVECCPIRHGIPPFSTQAGYRNRESNQPAGTSYERTVVTRAELEFLVMVQERTLAGSMEVVNIENATLLETPANGQTEQPQQPKKNRKKKNRQAKAKRELCGKTHFKTDYEIVLDWNDVLEIANLKKSNYSIRPLYLVLLAQGKHHSRMQEFYDCVDLDRIPLKAAERLTTGRLIAMEKAHCWLVFSLLQRQTRCDRCLLLITLHPLACDGCNLVMYCSTDCQESAWKSHHQLECRLMAKLPGNDLSVYFMSILRCLCMTLGEFEYNYAAMRSYFLDKKPFVPLNLLDCSNMSKRDIYCAKLCKPALGWLENKPNMRLLIEKLHRLISECLNDQILEPENDAFLESFVEWHVFYAVNANWIEETIKYDLNCYTMKRRKFFGTYPLLAMMEKSCNPNVVIINVTPKIRAAFAMKTIEKGDPLTVQCACKACNRLYATLLEDSSEELQQETVAERYVKQQDAAAKVNSWGVVNPPYSKLFWLDMKKHLIRLGACFSEYCD